MFVLPPQHLVRLRARAETLYVSQNRTVLATRRDGFINAEPDHGFFVQATRLLSRYEYLLNGRPPFPSGLSSVGQHTWLGYYVAPAPDAIDNVGTQGPGGATAQQAIELRLSRFVSDGLHEDVDVTNFTQQPAHLTLALRVDTDFADTAETKGKRLQRGKIRWQWRAEEQAYTLTFSYEAEHDYSHQGEAGTAHLRRGVTLRVEHASSPPAYRRGTIRFEFRLEPHATWHVCIDVLPLIDGHQLPSQYRCRSFTPAVGEYDRRRQVFLHGASSVRSPAADTLAPVVIGALEQGKRDLVALRLHDYDHGDHAWTMAAGLPVYVALFGRDTLTAAWQAAMASHHMMAGTLAELARWQGTDINDWRDEQPGRMLHQAENGPLAMLNLHPLRRYYGSITTSGFYPVVEEPFVRRTADRLFQEDMFTGWGIRTLSDRHPAYNPYSYHRGSVWPVEHGSFAVGLMRYGLHDHVERLCRAQFEAAALFDFYRLPELFAGHPRDANHPFPAHYPNANSPQAWSASAVWCLLQSMLGLYPYAPLNLLLLDPYLPEWLPEISLHNLHVGAAVVDLRFYRRSNGDSDYEVLDKRGRLNVVRQPSPWSLTATFGERLQDALSSLVPA